MIRARSVVPMRVAKIGTILISVLFCMTGILLIALPKETAPLIGIVIGATMILFGIVKLIGFFSKDLFRLAFQFDLEFGILMIVLGGAVVLHPQDLMRFLAVVFGIAVLAEGLFKIRIARDSKRFGIKSWWLILLLAVITGIAGGSLIVDSALGSEAVSILIGISLLFEGVLNLFTVMSTVLIIKHQMPDVIEVDLKENEV